jgi:hypothetical protein
MKTITLKEYVERKLSDGLLGCSKNISESGYIKIEYVMSDWWVKAANGMSYCCCPTEPVYLTN